MPDPASSPLSVPVPDGEAVSVSSAPPRLRSLDVFRGLTVALMIVVNNPGSWSRGWGFLRHAPWNGWTVADLVFPWFLLAVGISIPVALGRQIRSGKSRAAIAGRAARRALALFVIGLALAYLAQQELATLRIPGVLQRIAVCYLAASLLFLAVGYRALAVAAAALLVGYWAILRFVPVPGGAAGILTPEGSIVGFVDRLLLGPHVWSETKLFDPEGILSTLPAIASTLLGVLVGGGIEREKDPGRRGARLVAAGLVAALAGLAWGAILPINKSIWTSSYALFAGGLGVSLFGALSLAIEARGLVRGIAPMEAFGANALAMFVFSGAASRVLAMIRVASIDGRVRDAKSALYVGLFLPLAPPPLASFLWSLATLAFWMAVAWSLRERRIVLKI